MDEMNNDLSIRDPSVSRALFHPRREDPGYQPAGKRTATCSGDAVTGGCFHDVTDETP